tara:strand:- start:364 stop:2610 length:2247 start_codon:yes stop_codon:yes gene_type:complete
MSGKHKHGTGKHKHNKQQLLIDKLGKEGVKLLVKGKLKHIPNITIRQPNKKPRDNSKKKEDLEEIAREIQKNIKEFQGKKNVVERVMGGGGGGGAGGAGSSSVSVVPIHIPQFSVPQNPSKNNLNDINNTVLETENDLREFYERENEGRSFLEIEEIYEDNPDEFDDLPILEEIDEGEDDILPEDENEGDRMIQEAQNIPQPVNDDIDRLRELFEDMRNRQSGIPIIEEPESEDDNDNQQLAIEAPEQLAIELPPDNPMNEDIQNLSPPTSPSLLPAQQNLNDWTEIPDILELPPAILANVYRPRPERTLMDNISDVVDITEGTILNWFSEAKPKKLALNQSQSEFEAYDRTEEDAKLFLEQINDDQDELIRLKDDELKEKEKILQEMEDANKLTEKELNNLENEIGKSLSVIENMKEGKEKDEKIKEAQILSLQLEGFEKQEELRDTIEALNIEVDDTKNELDNLKNLQKPAKLSLNSQNEFENITQFQLSTQEEEQLQNQRNREIEAEKISENLQELGIRHNIGSYNNIIKLEELRQEINDDELFTLYARSIYENGGENVAVKKFLKQMTEIINRPNRNFEAEEELQRQIVAERVRENEYENDQSSINDIKNNIDKNKTELDKKKTLLEQKRKDLEIYKKDLFELENEYDNLVSTLEAEFERNNINDISDINEIEDDRDRESLLALWSYINTEGNELNNYIEEMKDKLNILIDDIYYSQVDYDDDKEKYEEQLEEYERIIRKIIII